jgi:dienelactone hydrolase
MRNRWLLLVVSGSLLLFLSSCSGTPSTQQTTPAAPAATAEAAATKESTPLPTETPKPFSGDGPWEVNFKTQSDGTTLYGILYGQGQTGVLLAPTYPGGTEGWRSFAEEAAAQGYRVLTFDFRGQEKSEGERSFASAAEDMDAAIALLREAMVQRIVIVGAGMGGMAGIQSTPNHDDVIGLAVISSARTFGDLEITDADLAALKIPSLWLGARNDMTQNVEDMYAVAGGSDKQIWIYDGSSLHGTFILEGADGPDLERRLLEFVAHVAGS